MLNALSTESPVQEFAGPGVPSPSRAGLRPLALSLPTVVAITSIVTETVHPTLFVTEVTTMGMSLLETPLSNAGQSQGEKSSGPGQMMQPQTVQTNTSQSQTVQLSISTAATQLTVLSSASSAVSASTISALASTTVSVATAATSTSSSIASMVLGETTTPTSTQASSSTLVTLLAQTISTSLSSQSPSPSPSPSPSASPQSSTVAAIISGSDSTNGQPSQSKSYFHRGAIVGGTIGGTVFLVLALLACILCLRGRRRRLLKSKGSPGRGLLRNSSDSLDALRDRFDQQESQCSYPIGPIFSPRSNITRPALAPNSAVAASKQGLSLNTMVLHRDAQQDPFSDPGDSPVSPIINVYPPSRTVSNYSQSSWEGDLNFLGKSDLDLRARDPHPERIYLSNESTGTLPLARDSTLAPQDDRKTRLSTRSDPFDLEVPPTALHEWPPLPRPTPWGDKF